MSNETIGYVLLGVLLLMVAVVLFLNRQRTGRQPDQQIEVMGPKREEILIALFLLITEARRLRDFTSFYVNPMRLIGDSDPSNLAWLVANGYLQKDVLAPTGIYGLKPVALTWKGWAYIADNALVALQLQELNDELFQEVDLSVPALYQFDKAPELVTDEEIMIQLSAESVMLAALSITEASDQVEFSVGDLNDYFQQSPDEVVDEEDVRQGLEFSVKRGWLKETGLNRYVMTVDGIRATGLEA